MNIFDDLVDLAHLEAEPDYQISAKAVRDIRRAITFGIFAAADGAKINQARASAQMMRQEWPEAAHSVAPGDSFEQTIQEMAGALLWLEYASHLRRPTAAPTFLDSAEEAP